MYWAAHRVRSPEGEEGINAFSHRHGPGFRWPVEVSQIAALPETDSGKQIAEHVQVEPGGNSVLSYLDVLAPDGTPQDVILRALDVFSARVSECANPTLAQVGPVVFRFLANRRSIRREDELRVLASSIEALVLSGSGEE